MNHQYRADRLAEMLSPYSGAAALLVKAFIEVERETLERVCTEVGESAKTLGIPFPDYVGDLIDVMKESIQVTQGTPGDFPVNPGLGTAETTGPAGSGSGDGSGSDSTPTLGGMSLGAGESLSPVPVTSKDNNIAPDLGGLRKTVSVDAATTYQPDDTGGMAAGPELRPAEGNSGNRSTSPAASLSTQTGVQVTHSVCEPGTHRFTCHRCGIEPPASICSIHQVHAETAPAVEQPPKDWKEWLEAAESDIKRWQDLARGKLPGLLSEWMNRDQGVPEDPEVERLLGIILKHWNGKPLRCDHCETEATRPASSSGKKE